MSLQSIANFTGVTPTIIKPAHALKIRKKWQKGALFCAPLLVLVFAANTWRLNSRKVIETGIAFVPNPDLRASMGIQEISKQMGEYPHANIYSVRMVGNGVYADSLLSYDRPKHRLIRKDVQPMGNGMKSWWENVSNSALRKAAMKSAGFNDMGKYGCKSMF